MVLNGYREIADPIWLKELNHIGSVILFIQSCYLRFYVSLETKFLLLKKVLNNSRLEKLQFNKQLEGERYQMRTKLVRISYAKKNLFVLVKPLLNNCLTITRCYLTITKKIRHHNYYLLKILFKICINTSRFVLIQKNIIYLILKS